MFYRKELEFIGYYVNKKGIELVIMDMRKRMVF